MIFQQQITSHINPKYLEMLPDFKERKIQAFTTLSLTLVALSLLGIFAIGPTLSTISELQRQYDDSKFVYDKLTEKLNNLGILQQKYSAIQNDIPVVLAAIPSTPTAPTLMAQIQQLAKSSNVTLDHLQVFEVDLSKQDDGPQKYSAFVFSIDAEGDYKNLVSFIQSITAFQRLITIQSITINKTVSQADEKPKASVRATAYFKKL